MSRAAAQLHGFDVARVRGLYLTVAAGPAVLDGPFGALQPESVIRAIVATLRGAPTQPGSAAMRSQRSAAAVARCRRAFADLLGADRDAVVLAATPHALHTHFAELISRPWQLGDQIVLSRLDSDSVLGPWLRAARTSGASVRWAEADLETGELPEWQFEHLITPHTRLVSVPLGNPATGTVPDVASIAARAHAVGALVLVDAGAAAGHLTLDLAALGADVVTVSAASFGGPTLAALATRPDVLRDLAGGPHAVPAQRFDPGPVPVELVDGATAAVDHLADLDERADGTRRARLATSVAAARGHTAALWTHFAEQVAGLPHVTVLGAEPARLPMAAFTVARRRPAQVGEFLARRGVSVWTGPSGMTQLLTALGADELGGASVVGFMPHTTSGEVDALVAGLRELS